MKLTESSKEIVKCEEEIIHLIIETLDDRWDRKEKINLALAIYTRRENDLGLNY